ncbi:MAG: DMT family transporter, partial [Deltaproteobacteria bacterium]|nr:DMT family transporter [Deltaproteobacteria bacterium]
MGRSTQSPPARPLDLRPRLFPLLLLVGANLIWGGSYTVMKLALTGLTPYQVSLWRMLPAGLLALPLLVWQLRRHAMPGRVWPVLGVVALLAFVGTKLLEVVGVNLSSATNAALLLSMEPLFTLALGVVVLKERISRRRGASFLLGVFGAYVLISRGLRPPEWSAAHVTGDLLFLLGLTFEATTTIIGARYARRYPALLVTMATITLSLGVWLPLGLAEVLGPGAPDFTP